LLFTFRVDARDKAVDTDLPLSSDLLQRVPKGVFKTDSGVAPFDANRPFWQTALGAFSGGMTPCHSFQTGAPLASLRRSPLPELRRRFRQPLLALSFYVLSDRPLTGQAVLNFVNPPGNSAGFLDEGPRLISEALAAQGG
jgi:hypothetical protein